MTEPRAGAPDHGTAQGVIPAGHILAAGVIDPAAVLAEAIRYAGKPCELSVSTVSEHTAQVVLAPLDDQGRHRAFLQSFTKSS